MNGLNCGRVLYAGSMCPRGKTCGGRPNSLSGMGDCVAGGVAGDEALPSCSGLGGASVVAGASVLGEGSAGGPGVDTGEASAG